MKILSILFLRIASGLLMVLWGLDKLVNPDHAMFVSNTFYMGLFSLQWILQVFGLFQVILGLLIAVGFCRQFAYPVLLLITTCSMLAVWKSVIDPLGFFFEGSKRLFFPSLIIFCAVLVLIAFRKDDKVALDLYRNSSHSST
jgi:putative oxidoreductase